MFVLIRDIHFWLIDPKMFLKASLATKYTNCEAECAPKKCDFLSNFSLKKGLKRLLWPDFFKNLPAAPKILST